MTDMANRIVITVSDETKRAVAAAAGQLRITEGEVVEMLIPVLNMGVAKFGNSSEKVSQALVKAEMYIASDLVSGNSPKDRAIVQGLKDVPGVDEI